MITLVIWKTGSIQLRPGMDAGQIRKAFDGVVGPFRYLVIP